MGEADPCETVAESEGMARRLIDWINISGEEIKK
jgi:hypothetical protein